MTTRNLGRQFELLRDLVSIGLKIDFKVNIQMITALHAVSMIHLVDNPGHYRDQEAHITNSSHVLPKPELISNLISDYIVEIHKRWAQDNRPFFLAAFVLWKFVWIHPFEDGNGRTARALAYLVICLQSNRWLQGTKLLPEYIKDNAAEYKSLLASTDESFKNGNLELGPLAFFLAKLIKRQLTEANL